MEQIQNNLAENLIYLRKKKGWNQEQLAEAAGIPRTTITNMESGHANPSLKNLTKLSAALQIGVEELLAKPRKECYLIKAADVPVQEKKVGGAKMHKLLPEKIRGLEIDKLCLEVGQFMTGTPHIVGTKEYFYCQCGKVEITLLGEKYVLSKGDVLAFPGDVRHVYKNAGKTYAEGFGVVVPLPAGY
jgi:transcriptional regulator with XRE-family HTH domain